MPLYIAGINHFDPMSREHVADWFRSLGEQHAGPPAFVAIEFDEAHFKALTEQRPRYREWIQARWPEMPPSDLDRFEQSLGYEGDTHHECFADTETIWLDSGREFHQTTIETHTFQRLLCLQLFEKNNSLMLPGIVSEQVQAYMRANVFSPERSRLFADRILQRVQSQSWQWAIAITGASHASDRFDNSMRSLLERAGVPCDVRYFCRLD